MKANRLAKTRLPAHESTTLAEMFLSADELTKFTGYKQPSKQIAWLRQYGIRTFVSRTGHPRVLHADLNDQQSHDYELSNVQIGADGDGE